MVTGVPPIWKISELGPTIHWIADETAKEETPLSTLIEVGAGSVLHCASDQGALSETPWSSEKRSPPPSEDESVKARASDNATGRGARVMTRKASASSSCRTWLAASTSGRGGVPSWAWWGLTRVCDDPQLATINIKLDCNNIPNKDFMKLARFLQFCL